MLKGVATPLHSPLSPIYHEYTCTIVYPFPRSYGKALKKNPWEHVASAVSRPRDPPVPRLKPPLLLPFLGLYFIVILDSDLRFFFVPHDLIIDILSCVYMILYDHRGTVAVH